MVDSTSSDALPGPNVRPVDQTNLQPANPITVLREQLEGLYRSHCGKVVGYFRSCGVDDAVARELAQETFVNALRGLAKFKGQSKLSTWMWTIARNVLLAHVRIAKPPGAEGDPAPIEPDSLSNGADPRLIGTCECVRRGFAAFSADHPERAEAVYLAVVEGWTREELAAFLGRTPHAATEYLSQCKARLRPYIEGCDGP